MEDDNSSFGSQMNQLQSAQRLDSYRKSLLANSAARETSDLKESPQREEEPANGDQTMTPSDQVITLKVVPQLRPFDNAMEFRSDSEMNDDCQSPTKISKMASLGKVLSTNSNQGTCQEDESMNTPEFQFDESNQINKDTLCSKEGAIMQ